jgi:hypothetical protein
VDPVNIVALVATVDLAAIAMSVALVPAAIADPELIVTRL